MTKLAATEPYIHAAAKTIPAVLPGASVMLADQLDIINTIASITLMSLSAAFLVWRWRVAWVKEKSE